MKTIYVVAIITGIIFILGNGAFPTGFYHESQLQSSKILFKITFSSFLISITCWSAVILNKCNKKIN